MSDVQIYDEAWTTDDIAYDYANPQKLVTDSEDTSITLDNLKAWWHLSEGDGGIAYDSAPLIGKELLTNTSVNNASYWNTTEFGNSTATITSNGGLITVVGGDAAYVRTQSGSIFTVGKSYEVTVKVQRTTGTGGKVKVQQWANSPFATLDLNGELQEISYKFVCELADSLYISREGASGDYVFLISNVSIKEVYNIDGETYDGSSLGASYVDAQERIPQLGMMNWSKGSNLITYSEDLTEWTLGSNATLTYESDVIAPDGTVGVYRLLLPATAHTYIQSPTFTAGSGRVFSMWVKKTNNNNSQFNFYDATSVSATFTATNEWQRFEMTGQSGNSAYVLNHGDTFVSDIYIWGGQVESSTGMSVITASAYRRTNGTAVTDATLISSATDSQKDILGNAVRVKGSGFNLDGTGYGEVEHNTDFDFGTGDFSVSAWVKFSYISQGSSYNAIYTNGGQVDSAGNFGIMTVIPNKVRILVNNIPCDSTTTFNQGEWLHMVATRNSGTISLYINGNKTPENTATNGNTVTSSQNPRIGFDNNASRLYNDLIDDVQVYDRYLTPEEVEQNYNATKSGHNN